MSTELQVIKLLRMSYIDYNYLSGNSDPWFCLRCNSQLSQFGTLDKKNFMQNILNSSNIKNDNENEFNNLVLETLPSLSSLIYQFNTSNT